MLQFIYKINAFPSKDGFSQKLILDGKMIRMINVKIPETMFIVIQKKKKKNPRKDCLMKLLLF